jgi:hypothetical protein
MQAATAAAIFQFNKIKDHMARLERRQRRAWAKDCSGRAEGDGAVDPFTREPPDASEVMFVYERPNGVVGRLDASRLIDYMLATGNFSDPETRQPFSDEAIRQLDVFCLRLGKPSVADACRNQSELYKQQRFIQDALVGIERLAGEKVGQVLQVVDAVNEAHASAEDAQVVILSLLPEFQHLFELLVQNDREFALASKRQYLTFLRGPPNRRTRDEEGILSIAVASLGEACDHCLSKSPS